VGVTNIFELLEDETDENKNLKAPQIQQVKQEEPAKIQKEKAPQKNSAAPNKPADKGKGANESNKGQGQGQAQRQAPDNQKVDKKPNQVRGPAQQGASFVRKDDRQGTEKKEKTGEVRERTDRPPRANREGGGGGGRGGFRGNRGEARPPGTGNADAQQRSGKRTYDRKSGTGRGKDIKKGGSGMGNWGTYGDDVVEEKPEKEEAAPKQENAANGAVAQEKTEGKPEENKTEKPVVEQPPQEKDEEESTRTYDEFLKLQAEKNARLEAITLPKERKPGEGVDQAAWKGFVVLERAPKDEDEEDEEEEDGKLVREKKTKDVKKVPFTEVLSIRHESPKRDGDGGRGGRGRGRGGRGRGRGDRDRDRDGADRGADRGARRMSSKPITISVDDQNFPALT